MPVYLGIDIRSNEVLVAAVKTAYRKEIVQRLVSVPIDQGIGDPAATEKYRLSGVGTEATVPRANVIRAIQEAARAALLRPGTSDGVAVSVSGGNATTRILRIPKSAEKQLDEVLPYELVASVPFELDEMVFDHKRLGLSDSDPEWVHVFTGVARAEVVKGAIDLVKDALTVEPDRVSLGGSSLPLLLEYVLDAKERVLFVEIGETETELALSEKGETTFLRTLSFGTRGLPDTAGKLAREIRLSLASHRAVGGELPEVLYLVGPGANVNGAESFLSAELELPVRAFSGMTIEFDEGAKGQDAEVGRFASALALALSAATTNRSFNLRRGVLAFEGGFDWLREKTSMFVGFGAAIGIFFLISLIVQSIAASHDRAVYESALGKITKEVLGKEVHDATEATDLLTKQVGSPDEDPLPHADAFDVMVKLSELIPSGIKHDIEDLDIQKGHVTVHGIVGSIPDAETIGKALQNERCFADVKRGKTTQQPGSDRQKYIIEFDIKCPEDQKGTTKKKTTTDTAASASASAGVK